jgi:hypothetical protein
MNNYYINYKNYLITLDHTPAAIVASALHDNGDYFKRSYIFYSKNEIIRDIKRACNERIKNNFKLEDY